MDAELGRRSRDLREHVLHLGRFQRSGSRRVRVVEELDDEQADGLVACSTAVLGTTVVSVWNI